MVTKCPKCGQMLKAEPGQTGTCPKCSTKITFPEGHPKMGELVKCPHCGQTQTYRDGFCVNCDKSLEGKTESDLKRSVSPSKTSPNKKKLIGVLVAMAAALAIVWFLIPNIYSPELTEDQKDRNISKTYVESGYQEAMQLVVEYYGTSSSKALAWASILGEEKDSEIISELKVVDQSLSRDGDYYDYEAQIKNNSSETIGYIEVNIYLIDDSGDIVNTEWTNWSGSLPPGASTYLDKMIRDTGNIKKFRTEISEITIK